MKQKRWPVLLAALGLCVLLISCGGGGDATEEVTEEAPAVAAQPTKPPPIVEANETAPPAVPLEEVGSEEGEAGDAAAEPELPTAIPTEVPTEAPPTAAATETPTVAPTAIPPTAAPVVVQPTAVPPTATIVPPTAAPQLGANGLIASHFAIQERANLVVNGDVWFEFNIANSTGNDVPFDALGVMPKKDGVDRPQWYQHSYGGNDDVIPPGGLTWDDHINLPEAGNYTLRMVVCFDGPACQAQTGTWHTLSAEIPVTIR
jgi:hypothetical protein